MRQPDPSEYTVHDEPRTLTVGLRFRKGQAKVLRGVIEKLSEQDAATVRDHIELFTKAEEAAGKGEPMIVQADTLDQVRAIAAGFTLYGVACPAIESLSGLRL